MSTTPYLLPVCGGDYKKNLTHRHRHEILTNNYEKRTAAKYQTKISNEQCGANVEDIQSVSLGNFHVLQKSTLFTCLTVSLQSFRFSSPYGDNDRSKTQCYCDQRKFSHYQSCRQNFPGRANTCPLSCFSFDRTKNTWLERGRGTGPPPLLSLTKTILLSFLLVAFTATVTESCSSRSTPKIRPASPTFRPNVTFQTYACPPAYAAWYCLNGARCFTVKIVESILYNCECPEGFMGQRCEYKDLAGSYSRERVLLETASIAGGACFAIVLVFVVFFVIYVLRNNRKHRKMLAEDPYHDRQPLGTCVSIAPDCMCRTVQVCPVHIQNCVVGAASSPEMSHVGISLLDDSMPRKEQAPGKVAFWEVHTQQNHCYSSIHSPAPNKQPSLDASPSACLSTANVPSEYPRVLRY